MNKNSNLSVFGLPILFVLFLGIPASLLAVKNKNSSDKKSDKKIATNSTKSASKSKSKKASKVKDKKTSEKKEKSKPKAQSAKKVDDKKITLKTEKETPQKVESKLSLTKASKKSRSPKSKIAQKKNLGKEPIPEEKNPTYDEILYRDDDHILQIRARSFKQGNLAFLKIYSNVPNCQLDLEKYKVQWRDKDIPLIPYENYHIAILPIHPEEKPGIQYLDVLKIGETKIIRKKFPIEIAKSNFPERKMYSLFKIPKKYKPLPVETANFIQKCENKKQETFSLNTDNKIDGVFEKPLKKVMVTSPFYVKRLYGPKKVRPHGGIDLRGNVGEPIYAIQSGKVVIAERMYFEGIFTVIDHGNKMFTLYMHQSKLHVKEGDLVQKGDLIGEIGSTGMSTGPHLHLGLKVDGMVLNPLSVLGLNLF